MKLPSKCPSCGEMLEITELRCPKCGTVVRGHYKLNKFLILSPEEENFLLIFLISRGNLKEVQERLGISYPTAKARLEELLVSLGLYKEKEKNPLIKEILERLERGEITSKEAIKLIKEVKKNG